MTLGAFTSFRDTRAVPSCARRPGRCPPTVHYVRATLLEAPNGAKWNDRSERFSLASTQGRHGLCRLVPSYLSESREPLRGEINFRRHEDGFYDPRSFVMPVFFCTPRARQRCVGDLTKTSEHFETSFSRIHFRGENVCKSASIQFSPAPSQRTP